MTCLLKRQLRLPVLSVCAALVGMGLATGARADIEYYIVDLGDLESIASSDEFESLAFAINNDNEVVGMAQDISGAFRAFIWLPEGTRYNLGDGTGEDGVNPITDTRMWSLGSLLGTNSEDSAAFDINDDGWITGVANANVAVSGTNIRNRAFVWNPGGADPSSSGGDDALGRLVDLGTLLPSLTDVDSRGYGLSEVFGGTFRVVGVSNAEDLTSPLCATTDFGDPSREYHWGFETEFTTSSLSAATLAERRGYRNGADAYGLAWSFGVARRENPASPGTFLDYVLAGNIDECVDPNDTTSCGDKDSAVTFARGVRWESGATYTTSPVSAIPLESIDASDLDEFRGNAHATNQHGDVVGSASDGFLPICAPKALLWEFGVSTPVNLTNKVPNVNSAVALGVNNNRDVVGTTADTTKELFASEADAILQSLKDDGGSALLWKYDDVADDWTGYKLEDLVPTLCDGVDEEGQWKLWQAFDINDNGWIVGHGERVFGSGPSQVRRSRAFLLIPASELTRSCPWDCTPYTDPFTVGNGVVNIDDLVAVINSFGKYCPTADMEDFTRDCEPIDSNGNAGNGIVNIDDLLAVVNNFGSCGSAPAGATGSLRLDLVDFSSGWMDETGTIDSSSATAVSSAWTTFDANWDVYRVWVEVPNSTTYIDAVSGSEDNKSPALITNDSSSYYNNGAGGDYAPNPAVFTVSGFAELAFDTFVTIGNAESSGGNPSVTGTLNL
ncbi:MAG: hypothetical protein KC983_12085, partial [Phycisphaerales bacterium]|nr:hypothetical protein [Phycisphaerales bacterium]